MFTKQILCLGDNLTEGYYAMGSKFHPYTIELQRLLHNKALVLNSGHSFDTTFDLVKRVAARLYLHTFHCVCILGGTNDLWHHSAPVIFENLRQVHAMCHSEGVKTIAIGIPAMLAEQQHPFIRTRRLQVNEWLQTQLCGADQTNCYYFDLPTAMPLFDLSPQQQQLYWNDDVHFTPAGYNCFGTALYEFMMTHQSLNNNNTRSQMISE